jgi:uncharacterized protein YydD (DUF2326 family)
LLHFCLGAKKKDEFEAKIPQWEFTLEFELNDKLHSVSRNTSNQSVLYLDYQEIKIVDFYEWMEQRLFSIPSGVSSLTYRSLVSKFLRRGMRQYVDPRDTGDYSEYDLLVRNAFLLGIEVHLIAKKALIRDEITNLKKLRQNFKTDPLLQQFYSGGKDPDIHLSFLESSIEALKKDKTAFVVAENYYELQKEADELAANIEKNKNSAFMIHKAIENINSSMREQPDLPLERVKAFYGELERAFRDDALKHIDEVSSFHERLLKNRLARLSREKLDLLDKQKEIGLEIKSKQQELDKKLSVLGQARALDQYTTIVNQIAELTSQAQKLKDYKAIDVEYSNRAADLDVQLGEEVKKTNVYLEDTKTLREKHFGVFKHYVSKFYQNSPSGIKLHNNEGNNQKRFDFDVQVENDSSDGINEVRIFCYDLTLLTLHQNHKVDFIFHDSRLYSNMDVRQRAVLFKLAHEVSSQLGFQYIATMNPDSMSGMEDEFTKEEFKQIISDSIVLELKDDSPKGKLLGIQVDMHYD